MRRFFLLLSVLIALLIPAESFAGPFMVLPKRGSAWRETPITWNPADKHANITLSNGNMTAAAPASATWISARATVSRSTGRVYFEAVPSSGANAFVGIATVDPDISAAFYAGKDGNSWGYWGDVDTVSGRKYHDDTAVNTTIYGASAVIGIGIDYNYNEANFYKDGSLVFTFDIGKTALFPMVSLRNSASAVYRATAASLSHLPTSYAAWADGQANDGTSTWNPSDKNAGITLSYNNMQAGTSTSGWKMVRGTVGRNAGKRYFEVYSVNTPGDRTMIGVCTADSSLNTYLGADNYGWGYWGNSAGEGKVYHNDSTTAGLATYGAYDVVGVGVDFDADTVTFWKGGVLVHSEAMDMATVFPAVAAQNGTAMRLRTGSAYLQYLPDGYSAWD